MNLPNKLTMLRIILVPVFVAFILIGYKWVAFLVFILASVTDLLDGWIARKFNLVTTFGKFADPLADKLLVSAALICFVELSKIPSWFVIIIISREFIVSGLRMVAAEKKLTISASFFGKIKTTAQMALVILLIIDLKIPALIIMTEILFWSTLVLTIFSGFDYVKKYIVVLSDI